MSIPATSDLAHLCRRHLSLSDVQAALDTTMTRIRWSSDYLMGLSPFLQTNDKKITTTHQLSLHWDSNTKHGVINFKFSLSACTQAFGKNANYIDLNHEKRCIVKGRIQFEKHECECITPHLGCHSERPSHSQASSILAQQIPGLVYQETQKWDKTSTNLTKARWCIYIPALESKAPSEAPTNEVIQMFTSESDCSFTVNSSTLKLIWRKQNPTDSS